jgi:type II secretory ATPase GspE/PulE/Tfp pilus assembly ATPase PilB-like protein
MGVPSHLIGATLRLSVAQRLVRRLCAYCRQPSELTSAEAIALGQPEIAERHTFKPQGCLYCAGRGFAGRIGLFECMAPDTEIAALISEGINEADLMATLRRKGYRTLMEDAVSKVLDGLSTVAEVLEVATDF